MLKNSALTATRALWTLHELRDASAALKEAKNQQLADAKDSLLGQQAKVPIKFVKKLAECKTSHLGAELLGFIKEDRLVSLAKHLMLVPVEQRPETF